MQGILMLHHAEIEVRRRSQGDDASLRTAPASVVSSIARAIRRPDGADVAARRSAAR